MAIVANDLKLYLSASGNGGAITATELTGNNLLGTTTGAESQAGRTEYHCIYFKNNSAQTAFAAKVYIDSETSHAGVNAQIGLGTSAVNGTESTSANETTAPAGVTFSEADGSGNALTIGDIPAGQHKAVWVEYAVSAGTAAKDNYQITFGLEVDTGE